MLKASVTYIRSPEMLLKDFKPLVQKAAADVALHWHKDYMPGHFKTSAMNKYGYHKRGKRYMIKKAKVKGHQNPLVWSGRSEAMAKARAIVRTTGKSAKTIVDLPKYFYMYRKDVSLVVDKVAELGIVVNSEIAELADYFDQKTIETLKAIQTKERKNL